MLGACLLALTGCPETKARINSNWRDWCDSHEICQPDQGPPPPAKGSTATTPQP